MNERIKELVQEAIDYADKAYTYTPEEGFNIQEWDKIRLEKFAELILQECIEVCNSRVGNSDYNTGRMHCASDLREHFGVEE